MPDRARATEVTMGRRAALEILAVLFLVNGVMSLAGAMAPMSARTPVLLLEVLAVTGVVGPGDREPPEGLSFDFVPDVALELEIAEHGEHGGVGEVVRELVADLGDGGRFAAPEDCHDVELAASKGEGHADRSIKYVIDHISLRDSAQRNCDGGDC